MHPIRHAPPSIATGLLLTAVGVALLAIATALALRTRSRMARWERAEGEVVGHATRGRLRYPQVRFDAGGRAVVFTSELGSSRATRAVGEVVPVRYDATDPERACVDSVIEQHFVAFIVFVVGVLATFLGIAQAMLASS